MRLSAGAAVVATLAVVAAVLIAGITDSFGTGTRLQATVPGSFPDGAAADTFWDAALVDVPGVAVTGVHCHGQVRYELQLGATGPTQQNRCYAAMGMFTGSGSQWGVYITLPGDRAVYRVSENYQPWRYCIAGLIYGQPDSATAPPTSPC